MLLPIVLKRLFINTGGSDLEHNKHVGHVSTIMRSITSKDGNFSQILINLTMEMQMLHLTIHP